MGRLHSLASAFLFRSICWCHLSPYPQAQPSTNILGCVFRSSDWPRFWIDALSPRCCSFIFMTSWESESSEHNSSCLWGPSRLVLWAQRMKKIWNLRVVWNYQTSCHSLTWKCSTNLGSAAISGWRSASFRASLSSHTYPSLRSSSRTRLRL